MLFPDWILIVFYIQLELKSNKNCFIRAKNPCEQVCIGHPVKNRFFNNALMLFFYPGEGRIGVPILTDGSYQRTKKPSDPTLNKLLYYEPYGVHIIKMMFFCSATPKVCMGEFLELVIF